MFDGVVDSMGVLHVSVWPNRWQTCYIFFFSKEILCLLYFDTIFQVVLFLGDIHWQVPHVLFRLLNGTPERFLPGLQHLVFHVMFDLSPCPKSVYVIVEQLL